MIRIVFAVDAPFLGGAEYYVSRLALALDRARFDVAVLVSAQHRDPVLLAWRERLERDGVRVAEVPMRLPQHSADAVAILRAMDALAPDIVHVNMPGPYSGQNALLVPLARLAGARVAVTEHLPMVAPLWKRALVKRIAYVSLDAAVTMTGSNAHWLRTSQRVPAVKIRVIPNGVPATYGRGERRRNAVPVVVFAGNLLAHKGPARVVDALARVEAPWRLAIIGAGPEETVCRALVERHGLGTRVEFLGALPPEAVESHLLGADILALPSEIEGLPYTILEAMACGIPVVAGDVFGVPEAVANDETGILVNPTDTGELARALSRLLGDAALRTRMGANARARFEARFTLDRQVTAMENLYRSMLGRERERKQ